MASAIPQTNINASKRKYLQTRKLKEASSAYLFLLPAFIIISTFILYPAVKLIYFSMRSYDLLGATNEFIGFKNFLDLLNDGDFLNSFKNSLFFMVIVVPVQTAIALFMAVQVNKKIKGVEFFRTVYFFPVVTSFVTVALLWTYLYNRDFGLINSIMDFLKIPRQDFLANPNQAMLCVIVTCIWKSWGFVMMIYLAGLKEIPNELYESSDIDGAGFFKKFYFITFPMLKKTTSFIIIITTMDCFIKIFAPVFNMTQGGPVNSTDVLVYYIWRQAFRMQAVGYSSAAAVFMMIIVLIITVIQFAVLERKERD